MAGDGGGQAEESGFCFWRCHKLTHRFPVLVLSVLIRTIRGPNSDTPAVCSCSAVPRLLPCLQHVAKTRQKTLLKYLSFLFPVFLKFLRLAG